LDEESIVQRDYDINLILIGEEWSQTKQSTIKEKIPKYNDPIFYSSKEKTGIHHTYNYNFVSVSQNNVKELSDFMMENSSLVPIIGSDVYDYPVGQAAWITELHPEWVKFDGNDNVVSYEIDYRLIDAIAVERYLYEKFIKNDDKLNKANSVNMFFLAMDLDDIDFLRNYSIFSKDDSSGKFFSAKGLMGFGGNYNILFFDLYAVPWIDYDFQLEEYKFPQWIISLHDCNTSKCLTDFITFHTSEALQYVISPHLLYPIKIADKYVIDTIVYTKPGSKNTITPATMKNFVNKEKIKNEFEYLYPLSDWQVNFTLERRDTRNLTYDFKKELESTSNFVYGNSFGGGKSIQLLHSDKIQPHLVSWAQERKSNTDPNIVQIPVVIEIDSSNISDIYLDYFGVLGISIPKQNSDESCCAFGVTSQKKLWGEKIGFTDLLIHEVGHTAGLMHPFMSFNESENVTTNNYFNWYSSPMTYSFPNAGCGEIFYNMYSEPCGNASLSFTEFERNIISDARLASLWNGTNSNIQKINSQDSEKIIQLLQDSKNAYKKGDVYSIKGSIALAKEAHSFSQILVDDEKNTVEEPTVVEESIEVEEPTVVEESTFTTLKLQIANFPSFDKSPQYYIDRYNSESDYKSWFDSQFPDSTIYNILGYENQSSMPEWVRNNAKWWSDGLIDDESFVQGVQYLVKENIISIQDSSQSNAITPDNKIPDWVRNNAKWWSDGLIGEKEFLNGIEFLVSAGVIKIN